MAKRRKTVADDTGPITWIFTGKWSPLDNFYHAPIDMPGIGRCDTVEHAFQAAKARNRKARERIRTAGSPGTAKAIGKNPKLTQRRRDWERVRYGVMRTALEVKFATYPDLLALLKSTGSREIQEGNTWGDTVWGLVDGEGQNWLGRMLMDIRDNGFRIVRPADLACHHQPAATRRPDVNWPRWCDDFLAKVGAGRAADARRSA